MAYPTRLDPVKPRGVSIPDSLWERLKANAKKDHRTTSAFITILLAEALEARQKKSNPSFSRPLKAKAA